MIEPREQTPPRDGRSAVPRETRKPLSPRAGLTINLADGSSGYSSPNLPPHERSSNINIAVTPDIHQTTYKTPALQRPDNSESLGYFTQNPKKHDRPANPASDTEEALNGREPSSPTDLIRGAMSGEELLRRMSLATTGRHESIADIKSAAPDLALSGNIISATFTTPYTIKHCKSGEWVC